MNTADTIDSQIKPDGIVKQEYRTKIHFVDGGRETLTSVIQPSVTQAGLLQLLQQDRMVAFNMSLIKKFEVEMLKSIEEPRVIVP